MKFEALRQFAFAAALALLAAGPAAALDPNRTIPQYGHDTWTSQNGLPGESVYQILQTRDGFLWLRTSAGVVQFDGARFLLLTPELAGQTIREPVKAICRSAAGDLLVRTLSHTLLYKDGLFTDYRPPAPIPYGDIRVLFESSRHEVLIGADNFIYRIDGAHPVKLRDNTSWVSGFLEDAGGAVWIAATFGIFAYRDGNLASILIPKKVAAGPTGGLAMDAAQRVWYGAGLGVFRVQGSLAVAMPPAQQVHDEVDCLLTDRRGNLWAGGSTTGLHRIGGGSRSSYAAPQGLTDSRVLSLYEDLEGSLWVGTASGLDRFRDTSFITWTAASGLPSDRTQNAIEAHDGSVYAARLAAWRESVTEPLPRSR